MLFFVACVLYSIGPQVGDAINSQGNQAFISTTLLNTIYFSFHPAKTVAVVPLETYFAREPSLPL